MEDENVRKKGFKFFLHKQTSKNISIFVITCTRSKAPYTGIAKQYALSYRATRLIKDDTIKRLGK